MCLRCAYGTCQSMNAQTKGFVVKNARKQNLKSMKETSKLINFLFIWLPILDLKVYFWIHGSSKLCILFINKIGSGFKNLSECINNIWNHKHSLIKQCFNINKAYFMFWICNLITQYNCIMKTLYTLAQCWGKHIIF